MSSPAAQYPVTSILAKLNQVVEDSGERVLQKENARKIVSFVERMQPIFHQLDNVRGEDLPAPIYTALSGLAADLQRLRNFLSIYRFKSNMYLLTHCRSLNTDIEDISRSVGNWLALLAVGLQQNAELCKEAGDLSQEMKQAHFLVTETEERICVALDKVIEDGAIEKVVQNAIIMDIARALGMDPEKDWSELWEQFQILKKELQDSNNQFDLQIRDALQEISNNWVIEPEVVSQCADSDLDENELIPPFRSFLCPLTKQVMKNPVVLITEHTYERSAIEEWFRHCLHQGREPICPVTGQTVTSLELRPNLVLQQTIQEWYDRNVDYRIEGAISNLQPSTSMEDFERAVEEVHRISKESQSNRHTLRKRGVIALVLSIWQGHFKNAALLRTKALNALHSMVLDNEENKVAMVEANALKYAVKSLTSSLDKEKESAAGLIFELSKQPEICVRIGSEKSAILLLSGAASNLENVVLSNLAEQTFKRLEEVDLNVLRMADAGRLKPLLDRLCEGPEERQIRMAEYLAQTTLLSADRELVAKRGAKVLVNMLSSNVGKDAGLKALLNLSKDYNNAPILVNAGILPLLLNILTAIHTAHKPYPLYLKEMAAETLANLLSKPGHWEVAIADMDGNTMQSEEVIHNLLGLMRTINAQTWIPHLLQALYGVASSPQAADAAAMYIQSGNGIQTLVALMQDHDVKCHQYSLMLLSVLSIRMATYVAAELRKADQMVQLKEILKGSGRNLPEERAAAACILANIPLTDTELLGVLEAEFVGWIIAFLRDPRSTKHGRSTSSSMNIAEGLLGILLHFAKSSNPSVVEAIQEHRLMMVFKECLLFSEQSPVKQRAAKGLQILSEKAGLLTNKNTEFSPSGCLTSLLLLCKSPAPSPVLCPVHQIPCKAKSNFCLVEAEAVRPLAELLEHNNVDVQITAVMALSTLLSDGTNLRGGVEELLKVESIQPVFDLFYIARPGELQDKTVWMVERILRIEDYSLKYSIDQGLVKALVEAFRNGSQITKKLAQDALMNLKQLSGVSGGAGIIRTPKR